MNVIRSHHHEIYTEEINKVALSADDDKRVINGGWYSHFSIWALFIENYLKNKYNNIKWKSHKVCTKCKIEKSLTEFHKDKSNKSGYCSSCKTCKNIKAKELRQKYSRLETREIKDKKVCGRCKKEKNILEYVKNRCCKDGFDSECKDCKYKYNNAYSKARKLYDPEFKLLGNMRS